eukprot:scaffold13796_cov118-Isochrysis_galbana.AAC.4
MSLNLLSPPKMPVTRRMKVDLPQPESAARPITTGLELSMDTAAREATRGAGARPGASASAAVPRASIESGLSSAREAGRRSPRPTSEFSSFLFASI